MAEIRINATGGVKLYDADDSHYAQIVAGTITSNVDLLTLNSAGITVLDGAIDFDVASHDTSNGLKLGGTLVTATAAELNIMDGVTSTAAEINLIDGGTARGTTALADGDGILINDAGTMRMTTVQTVKTYMGGADPASADGDTLGTASLEWSDLYLADSSVIYFGNDQDTTLTHTDGTGLTLNSTNKLCFNDASQFIQGSSATVISIGATDEIDLTATAVDLNGTLDVSGTSQFNDDTKFVDDKGIVFGSGGDFALGANGGETQFNISEGSTTTGDAIGGLWLFRPTTDGQYIETYANEGKGVIYGYYQDQGDDADDYWRVGQGAKDGDANEAFVWAQNNSSYAIKARLATNGNWETAGTHSASVSFDYAEYFEWKTELASDEAATNAYGMTVVLDNDKIRLAEAGEEAEVIGVVRPNSTSSVVGGGQELQYKDKYEKNVWGEPVYEEYTQVDWDETRTKEDGGTYTKHHKYMKDRIPAKRIREGAPISEENWHTLESNFEKDSDGNFIDLVVPSTAEEKIATNYVERTTYKRDKGDHKQGDKLMRQKVNPSFDFTKAKSYEGRDKRRKEWCIVGLLGQVPIRDTAVIPTHWKLMNNLESGIDLYYIK